MATPKRPKTASIDGYGIMNPYGDMWTPEVFGTAERAKEHLERFWTGTNHDLTKFKIVRAKQTSRYLGEVEPTPTGDR